MVSGIWGGVAVLSALAMALLDLTGALYPLAASVALAAYYLVLATRGCTEFTDDAVHNTVLRTASIPWDEVDRIQLVRSGRAAWLQLVLDRRRIRLAAPRTGLIARDPGFDEHLAELRTAHEVTETRVAAWVSATAATVAALLVVAAVVVLDRPWLSDWWPGVTAAAETPPPCKVFDAPTLDRALIAHHDDGVPTKAFLGDGCQWQRLGDLSWDLVVSYDRFARTAKGTGADVAADAFTLFAQHEGRRLVPGLGDATYTWTSGAITSVLTRTANVLVEIEYNGDQATAIALARTATASVQLD